MSRNLIAELSKKISVKPYNMEELVLVGFGLSEILPLQLRLFPNLQVIYLNHNKLKELNNLNYNIRLQVIDARNNKISSVNIPKQIFLKELYLAHNNLCGLDAFIKQIIHLKDLEVLDLRENMLTRETGYRLTIISRLPSLKILDGIPVSKYERESKIVPNGLLSNIKSSVLTVLGDRSLNNRNKHKTVSFLEYLHTKPYNDAERIVKMKANSIREGQKVFKQERNDQEESSELREGEMFSQKEPINDVPLPDYLDFLGQSKKLVIQEELPEITKKSHGRMYIKTPIFNGKNMDLHKSEMLFRRLNPDLSTTPIRSIKMKTVFPY